MQQQFIFIGVRSSSSESAHALTLSYAAASIVARKTASVPLLVVGSLPPRRMASHRRAFVGFVAS
jgi:hypothetical protein